MPSNFPAVPTKKSFEEFLGKIQGIKKPAQANGVWLKALGYRSGNHSAFLTALRFIGVIGSGSAPTELWAAFRSPTPENKRALGIAIRKAYSDVFDTYDDAATRPTTDLAHAFKANSDAADQVVLRMVNTFQAMCAYATFDGEGAAPHDEVDDEDPIAPEPRPAKKREAPSPAGAGMVLNVNLQLTLPATADADIYDKLFASMRKNLIDLAK